MNTYTQILYQIVFSTKNRTPCLEKSGRKQLYKYIWGILKNKKCTLYRINGVEDHIHILATLHPEVSLASLVKDIKVSTNKYVTKNNLFPKFEGWQRGYGAFTYSYNSKTPLIEYIKNQEEHHRTTTFREEFIHILNEHEIEFDEKYLL